MRPTTTGRPVLRFGIAKAPSWPQSFEKVTVAPRAPPTIFVGRRRAQHTTLLRISAALIGEYIPRKDVANLLCRQIDWAMIQGSKPAALML